MSKWIKASRAKKAYGIPDRLYREALHGKDAIGFRPGGEAGHYYFNVEALERFLREKEVRR